jgi:transketolase
MKFQRDILIDIIYDMALNDKDIYFISADLGAPALDRFRNDLPEQFLHAGISEQNMIDVAAGLALSGKKVYVYAMGPFITLRCLEQLKCSLAHMNLPVTVISVGLGLGYADAGPTHYITEDLACLRAIVNFEVYTPSDLSTVVELAELINKKPALRVLRLDRNALEDTHTQGISVDTGFVELKKGQQIGILSCGYVLQRILKYWAEVTNGLDIGLVDVFRNKPLNLDGLKPIFEKYKKIITVEEQCLSGGFGSSILEAISDLGMNNPVKRLGLEDRYYFENGGREYLLNTFGLSNQLLKDTIKSIS